MSSNERCALGLCLFVLAGMSLWLAVFLLLAVVVDGCRWLLLQFFRAIEACRLRRCPKCRRWRRAAGFNWYRYGYFCVCRRCCDAAWRDE